MSGVPGPHAQGQYARGARLAGCTCLQLSLLTTRLLKSTIVLLPACYTQSFWSRLAGKYGNKFYWQEKGESSAIMNAVSEMGDTLGVNAVIGSEA